MSAAEIADNRWELESTKPKLATLAGIAQIVIITCLAIFFGFILVGSIMGLVTPRQDGGGLAGAYERMDDTPAKPATH